MKITKGLNPVVRAAGVISAVAIVTGGVTFAALSSSVTLSDNSLSTADASLKIYDFSTGAFGETAQGFTLNNLVPGEYTDKQHFYFLNDSEADLSVSASANDDVSLNGVAAEDVKIKFSSMSCEGDDSTVNTTLAALQAGAVELPCNPLNEGAQGNATVGQETTEGNYSVEFKVTNVQNAGASVNNLDLVFDGTIGTVTPPPTGIPTGE